MNEFKILARKTRLLGVKQNIFLFWYSQISINIRKGLPIEFIQPIFLKHR